MASEDEARGTCVRCGAAGPIGEPCPNPRCRASRNCFVPDEYALTTSSDAMLGVAIDGRYLVLALLGVGGFGRVYVARHLRTDQLVAIKQIDRSDPARAAELLREARTLARLKHPNIVLLQDYGELDGRPYMVMEHVAPVIALEDALLTAPSEAERLRLLRALLRQALDGLGYAHALGVIHRDLKPANMLIRRLPSELLVKIVDFGLAKCLDDGRTNSRDAGTPLYMAPEQIGRRAVSPATDLYALGVLLFTEVTGREPFDGSVADVLVQKVTAGYDPMTAVPAGALAPEMAALLASALAFDPAQRPQDTGTFRFAMERAFKAQLALVEAGGGVVERAPATANVGLGSAGTGVLELPAAIDLVGATMDAAAPAGPTATAAAAPSGPRAVVTRGAASAVETAPVAAATALAMDRAAQAAPAPAPRRPWRRFGVAVALAAVVVAGVAALTLGGGDVEPPALEPVTASVKAGGTRHGAWSAGAPVVLPAPSAADAEAEAEADAGAVDDAASAAGPDAAGPEAAEVAAAEVEAAGDTCAAAAGTWELTTTVTAARDKNAVGVTGFYGLVVSADCGFELVKTAAKGAVLATLREGDAPRASGVLTAAGAGRWSFDARLTHGERAYDARFDLEVGARLAGTWRSTDAGAEAPGYRGKVVGARVAP